jgi:hypothetical protein
MSTTGSAGGGGVEPTDSVNTVEEYLQILSAMVPTGVDHWYRGHASAGWDLTASVFRTPSRIANERIMLKRFIQDARRHLAQVPSEQWDWTFLAQHHQVPTRLLDWSESPLVGLYFASLDHLDIAGDPMSARDGRIWILRPTLMNQRQGFTFKDRDIPLFGLDRELDDYNPYNGVAHLRPPIAGLAARNFDRITAQWGTFTVTNAATPIELLPDVEDFLLCIDVPIAAKSAIREQLGRLGIEDRTIYLDLFRLGRQLGEVYG